MLFIYVANRSYIMVDDLEVKDFLESKDELFQECLPPSSLPHTLASLHQDEDDTPIYVTDGILSKVHIDESTASLFAPESKSVSRASSVIGSPRLNRRSRPGRPSRKHSEVMSVGSILHRNLLTNFSHITDLEENQEEDN